MYDAQLGRWHVADAMADKYKSVSPYNYVLNNPLKYVDPDGNDVQFAPGVSAEFKKAFAAAVAHLNKHGAAGMLASLHKSETTYYIAETQGGSSYNPETRTISWDPNKGSLHITDGELVVLSPTSVLNHEVDHANQHDKNPEKQKVDGNTPDPNYGNKEEKRVIEGSEQETAKKTGEIRPDQTTRRDHSGTLIPTKGPTSTEILPVIIKPKKERKKDE